MVFCLWQRLRLRDRNICLFGLFYGLNYLYGRVQISAWFILLLLHANPDPESVMK